MSDDQEHTRQDCDSGDVRRGRKPLRRGIGILPRCGVGGWLWRSAQKQLGETSRGHEGELSHGILPPHRN